MSLYSCAIRAAIGAGKIVEVIFFMFRSVDGSLTGIWEPLRNNLAIFSISLQLLNT
jgi:hypothetical protein